MCQSHNNVTASPPLLNASGPPVQAAQESLPSKGGGRPGTLLGTNTTNNKRFFLGETLLNRSWKSFFFLSRPQQSGMSEANVQAGVVPSAMMYCLSADHQKIAHSKSTTAVVWGNNTGLDTKHARDRVGQLCYVVFLQFLDVVFSVSIVWDQLLMLGW